MSKVIIKLIDKQELELDDVYQMDFDTYSKFLIVYFKNGDELGLATNTIGGWMKTSEKDDADI